MSRLVVVAVCGGLLVVASAQEPVDPVVALIAQLEGRDPKGRRLAAKDLGRRGGEQAIRALRQALGDDSESVRHEAAIALARLAPDEPKTVEVLIESLRNEDWYARWQACLALRSLGPRAEDAVPTLIRVLCHAKLDNCREATLALSAIAPKKREVVDALLRALESRHAVDRQAVAYALGRAGGAAGHAIPWLAREVHLDEHGFGEAAHRLLGPITHPHTEYFLLLFDPVEGRRVRAVGWIAGADREHYRYPRLELAVPVLVVALKDESWRVRRCVLEALGKIGKHANAKAAIPDIVRNTVSAETSVRNAARPALEVIAPSLARVIDVHAGEQKEGVWVARLSFPAAPSRDKGAHALLALLVDPAVGDATLAALGRITGRTKEDLLEAVRAEAAKEQAVEAKQEK